MILTSTPQLSQVQAALRKSGVDTKIKNGKKSQTLRRTLIHAARDPDADHKKKPMSTVFESWISDEYRTRNGETGFTVALDDPDVFTILSLKLKDSDFLKADLVRWSMAEDSGNMADSEDNGNGEGSGYSENSSGGGAGEDPASIGPVGPVDAVAGA